MVSGDVIFRKPGEELPEIGYISNYGVFADIAACQVVVLATCCIRRLELGCENTSSCLLLLANSSKEEYHLKH